MAAVGGNQLDDDVELPCRGDRATLGAARRDPERLDVVAAHRAAFLPLCRAYRHCQRAETARFSRALGALSRSPGPWRRPDRAAPARVRPRAAGARARAD